MKRLNVKFVVTLLASFFVAMVAIWGLHKFQVNRSADSLRERADIARDEGRLIDAVKLRSQYISHRRTDYGELIKLAEDAKASFENSLREGRVPSTAEYQMVYSALERATRENPDDRGIREKAVGFFIAVGRFADAVDHLNQLIDKFPEDPDPAWLSQKAVCLYQTGKTEEALDLLSKLVGYEQLEATFDRAAATQPENVDAYNLLATIYRLKYNDDETAERIVNEMVAANPDNYESYLRRTWFYQELPDQETVLPKAMADIERALELASDNLSVMLTAASLKTDAKDFAAARALLERCRDEYPDEERVYQSLHRWAIQQNNVEESVKFVNEGLEKHPDSIMLLWVKVNLQIDAGDFIAAEKTLATIRDLKGRSSFAGLNRRSLVTFMQARIDQGRKQFADAAKKFEEVRPDVANGNSEWLDGLDQSLARCYGELHKPDEQMRVLKTFLERNPDNLNARWELFNALDALGQRAKVRQSYDQLCEDLDSNPGLVVSLDKLPIYLKLEIDKQQERADDERDWRRAESIVKRIVDDERVLAKAKVEYHAMLLDAQGKGELAKKLRDQFYSDQPIDPLTDLVRRLDKLPPAEGLKEVDKTQGEMGDHAALRLIRARLRLRGDREHAKEILLSAEENLEGLPAEQRAPFLQQLGPLYLSVAEFREALRVFKQAATIDPTDEEARIIWFDLAQQLGDEREMDEVMELIGQNNGKDSAEYKWTQAMRVIWMVQNERTDISQLQKAQALLEDARGRRENWYVISQTEAKIHLLRNQIDRAINSLKETLEKGPPRGVVVRELARLLYGEGRKEEAYTYVKRLDEAEWGSLERRIAFEMQARSGVAPSELPVDESSTDPADHLWAGQVLAEVGKLEEAEKEMRRAAELGPSSPMVWKQLVRLLVVRKKMVDAEMAVRRAQLMLPEYELPMTMGDCYAMLNQAGLAQHHYMMALEQHPNDVNVLKSLAALYMALGNEPAARGMLDRIIGQEKPHAADANPTVTWARRVKAQMLAGTEVYEDFTKALRLIEENSPNRDSMSIADSVLWAKLSLARPEMSSRNEALRLLEATAKRRELTSEENLLLASLYEQVGRWPECQSLMVDILADRPNDTNLLQPWISWLLKHKDFGQAKQWLRNLDGRSTFAIEVSSELDVREKRTSDFLKTMQGLLAKSDDPNFVAQTAYFADLTDRLAKYDPSLKKTAEKLWRAHVQKNPDSRPSLAAFLGTTGDKAKAEEGLKILQSLNKDKIDPRYTAIGLAILRRSNHAIAADSPEFKMVGQWVKNALDNAPNSKSAIMHMAEYQDLSGNFAEVEMLYRKYLNMPDISPQQRAMVSNNLAYAMALEGNSKESLTLIEYAISVLGPRADLLDTRAIIHLVKEDPRAAIEDLEVAIIDSGGSSLELFHLAVAKLMANDEDGSREALQNAQEVGLDVRQLNKLEQSQYQNLVQKLRIKNS